MISSASEVIGPIPLLPETEPIHFLSTLTERNVAERKGNRLSEVSHKFSWLWAKLRIDKVDIRTNIFDNNQRRKVKDKGILEIKNK